MSLEESWCADENLLWLVKVAVKVQFVHVGLMDVKLDQLVYLSVASLMYSSKCNVV